MVLRALASCGRSSFLKQDGAKHCARAKFEEQTLSKEVHRHPRRWRSLPGDAAIRCKSGSMLASTKKKNAVLLSTQAHGDHPFHDILPYSSSVLRSHDVRRPSENPTDHGACFSNWRRRMPRANRSVKGDGAGSIGGNRQRPMSALGQKQTSRHLEPMSALPPKADIRWHQYDVRFVPKADIRPLGP